MNQIPPHVEQGFRWARETISLIYAHHRHPLPMVALIFMYAETFGKPLLPSNGRTTITKVCTFIERYLPELWTAFGWSSDREEILGNYYRNGLVHQVFMKENAGIHEDKSGDTQYVSRNFSGIPYSINIDRLVAEFLKGIGTYYRQLETDNAFLKTFLTELPK